jgi:UDP-N-acetylglucosamine 4,6-dehydratase
MLTEKTILITGGTGSLGQELVKQLVALKVNKVIVYSRNESKQVEMRRALDVPKGTVRYFLGDVRDTVRLERAFYEVDYIIHAAALKNLEATEYNPHETVRTNVYGTLNVVDAAINVGIYKVLGISSDKAVDPSNLYGATKLCADKIMIASNVYCDYTDLSVVRFGNFLGSSGSVLPLWEEQKNRGNHTYPITDMQATRFWITLEEAASYAINCLVAMKGGEIFTPDMKRAKVSTLAKAIDPVAEFEVIGLRLGEKLHEEIEANGTRISSSGTNVGTKYFKKTLGY